MGSPFAVPLDDVTLARARRGDEEALAVLVRTFEKPVFNLARRLLGDAAEAEDALQETFLEMVRSIHGYRGDGPFWGWIRKVAASKALMRLRARRGRAGQEPLDDGSGPAATTTELRARGDAAPAGDRVDLETALAALPDASRAVVWLHDVEGYTHGEIATLMGRTASFSKSQLARAHARLRDALRGEGVQPSCI